MQQFVLFCVQTKGGHTECYFIGMVTGINKMKLSVQSIIKVSGYNKGRIRSKYTQNGTPYPFQYAN